MMPLTRSLMPDLMVSALVLYALSIYLSVADNDTPKIIVEWCPARTGDVDQVSCDNVALFVPLILEKSTSKLVYFTLSAINVFLLGEVWLFVQYDQWHLLTVVKK